MPTGWPPNLFPVLSSEVEQVMPHYFVVASSTKALVSRNSSNKQVAGISKLELLYTFVLETGIDFPII
jgi:hypothetical protein